MEFVFFSTDSRKILKYQIASKSEWEPSWSMRMDRQTGRKTDKQIDMTELTL